MCDSNVRKRTIGHFEYEIPKGCPHCYSGEFPIVFSSTKTILKDGSTSTIVMVQCPVCSKFFALQYILKGGEHGGWKTELIPYTYQPIVTISVPEKFDKFSPDFKVIYKQAEIAYKLKLNKICGMGYRKAIEQLVKDFLIFSNPNDKEKILKLNLSQAINRIDNDKIKILSKAVTYLANDHVHLINKHPDRDIEDIRNFISSLIAAISLEYDYLDASGIISENWDNGSVFPIKCPSGVWYTFTSLSSMNGFFCTL